MHFSYINPTMIHFGQGQIARIRKAIPKQNKILVLYGGGSIKRNGVYDQVAQALQEHQWIEFSGIEPNPTKETLDKAVQIVKNQDIDLILAVGGGSVIDGSKYVAAAAYYDGDGWDILTGKHTVQQAKPIGAILTLPATGSESNAGAVITKAATQEKLDFFSRTVQPQFAILDPDVMKTLPERQLINGLVDAWVHVCEQYLTLPTQAMVQDGYAEVLLRSLLTLGNNFAQRDCDVWRSNLMWTANQALNGLIGSGVPHDWATHMIGHELTALWQLDHARSLAIIQPWLLRNQLENKRAKLEQMGIQVFGLPHTSDLAEQTIAAIEEFYHQLNVATQFAEYGMEKEAAVDAVLQKLADHGMHKLGEREAINLQETRNILEHAFK